MEGFTSKDVKELQEEVTREGMMGISPRYVINRLSSALVKEGASCINPLDALRALKDGFEQHTGISKDEKEAYLNFIYEARKSSTKPLRPRSSGHSSTPLKKRPAQFSTTILITLKRSSIGKNSLTPSPRKRSTRTRS